jgi:hypothetical protein
MVGFFLFQFKNKCSNKTTASKKVLETNLSLKRVKKKKANNMVGKKKMQNIGDKQFSDVGDKQHSCIGDKH